MIRILVNRIARVLPVLVIVSIGAFLLLELVPGDPSVAVLGPNAQPTEYERVREQLGLNQPLTERYVSWVGGVVTGDLGQSIFPPNRDVSSMIAQRLPVTLQIAAMSMVLSLLIAVPVALITSYRAQGYADRAATGLAFAAISIPPFLAGLMFVFFFVFNQGIVRVGVGVLGLLILLGVGWTQLERVRSIPPSSLRTRNIVTLVALCATVAVVTLAIVLFFPQFPRQGFTRLTEGGLWSNLRSIALPVLTLTLTECAVLIRVLRSDLMDTLGEDYILAAKAKGMPAWRIMVGDALRPSLFSLVTLVGVTIGRLIGGSVIVEIIFNLPGMGRLIIDSITVKDYPVVQASVLMIAVVYVAASAMVDVLYAYLDPRIRRG